MLKYGYTVFDEDMNMKELNLTATDSRSVILIEEGLLHRLPELVRNLFPLSKVLIVTDENVEKLYGKSVYESLARSGIPCVKKVLPFGERTKSFEYLNIILDCLGENGFTRSDAVMALGGGVIGDLSGFAAALWQRGMKLIQAPTTLLAQIDSSIGGKTAIDTKWGKNTIGAFKQPDLVCIDPQVLTTLSKTDFSAGMAEMIKYACIRDKEMFRILKTHSDNIFPHLSELILQACKIKKEVVEEDCFDTGLRMILNFGHTVAHVLEGLNDFEGLPHGYAVALGMIDITKRSEALGCTLSGTADQIQKLCDAYGLPTEMPAVDKRAAVSFLLRDKKARSGQMNLVLLKEIGSCFIKKMDVGDAIQFLGWEEK